MSWRRGGGGESPDVAELQRSLGNRALGQASGRRSEDEPAVALERSAQARAAAAFAADVSALWSPRSSDPVGAAPVAPIQCKLSPGFAAWLGQVGRGTPRSPVQDLQRSAARLPAGAGGQPLARPLREAMEGSFGADFSDVRIHQDEGPSRIGALAYTRGSHIHFSPGVFDPGNAAGRSMLGHELAHVLQQRSGRVTASPGRPVILDRGLEAEADVLGRRAAAGESVAVPGAAGPSAGAPGIQRLSDVVKGAATEAIKHGLAQAGKEGVRRAIERSGLPREQILELIKSTSGDPRMQALLKAAKSQQEALQLMHAITAVVTQQVTGRVTEECMKVVGEIADCFSDVEFPGLDIFSGIRQTFAGSLDGAFFQESVKAVYLGVKEGITAVALSEATRAMRERAAAIPKEVTAQATSVIKDSVAPLKAQYQQALEAPLQHAQQLADGVEQVSKMIPGLDNVKEMAEAVSGVSLPIPTQKGIGKALARQVLPDGSAVQDAKEMINAQLSGLSQAEAEQAEALAASLTKAGEHGLVSKLNTALQWIAVLNVVGDAAAQETAAAQLRVLLKAGADYQAGVSTKVGAAASGLATGSVSKVFVGGAVGAVAGVALSKTLDVVLDTLPIDEYMATAIQKIPGGKHLLDAGVWAGRKYNQAMGAIGSAASSAVDSASKLGDKMMDTPLAPIALLGKGTYAVASLGGSAMNTALDVTGRGVTAAASGAIWLASSATSFFGYGASVRDKSAQKFVSAFSRGGDEKQPDIDPEIAKIVKTILAEREAEVARVGDAWAEAMGRRARAAVRDQHQAASDSDSDDSDLDDEDSDFTPSAAGHDSDADSEFEDD